MFYKERFPIMSMVTCSLRPVCSLQSVVLIVLAAAVFSDICRNYLYRPTATTADPSLFRNGIQIRMTHFYFRWKYRFFIGMEKHIFVVILFLTPHWRNYDDSLVVINICTIAIKLAIRSGKKANHLVMKFRKEEKLAAKSRFVFFL